MSNTDRDCHICTEHDGCYYQCSKTPDDDCGLYKIDKAREKYKSHDCNGCENKGGGWSGFCDDCNPYNDLFKKRAEK